MGKIAALALLKLFTNGDKVAMSGKPGSVIA